jgi:hypothetical protein
VAYETGAALDENDLLDKIKTFAVASGWSLNLWATDGDGWRLHLKKGDQYVNLRSTLTNPTYTQNTGHHIWLGGSDGFDAGDAWNAQPGASPSALLRDMAGPYAAYHFFANGDSFFLVVEQVTGTFRHAGWGLITKTGLAPAQSGAHVGAVYELPTGLNTDSQGHSYYFDAGQLSNPPGYRSHLRADVDGVLGWVPMTGNVSSTPRCLGPCRNKGLLEDLMVCQPNTFNEATAFFPMVLAVSRASSYWSIVGYPPDIALCDITNYADGQEVAVGADTWKLFPWSSRERAFPGTRAYAFKKVA